MVKSEPSQFLAIARIVKPQGRRGEVIAELATDFPDRFNALRNVYLENPGKSPFPALLENVWKHKSRIVLKFAGIDTIEAASHLRGALVLIPSSERVDLPENSYYWSELVGCRVVLSSPKPASRIGTVTAVEPTGGVALLHVAPDASGKKEVLVPFTRAICKRIDTQSRTIEIDPPEDLLNLNDESG